MLKAVIGTAVALAVIGGGGYLADNAVRAAAEDQVATAIVTQLGLPERPDVQLGGFPFSLALLIRSVPDATASAARLPLVVSGHEVDFTAARLRTGQISLTDDLATVAAADATATLGYAELAEIAEVPVGYAGDGRLELRYDVVILRRTVSVAVSALPRLDVDAAVIRLAEPRLDLAGVDIGIDLSQDQIDTLVQPISVALDHGLRLTEFSPSEAGAEVRIGGENLTFPLN